MTKLVVVVDTNVYVSATTIYPNSPPRQILEAWRNNKIEFAISEPLLDELVKTLKKPRVQKLTGFTLKQQKVYVRYIHENSLVVSGTTVVDISRDSDDNQLFSCAVEANADYIISGDKKHVLNIPKYKGVQTISPRDFVEKILL